MVKFSPEKKRGAVASVDRWYHSIDLGNGIVTPGTSSKKTQLLRASFIPKNLGGKSVLDVGSWDGYYSFECEKRGAKVTALEKDFTAGFKVAKKVLGSKVELLEMDLFDLPMARGKFDVVLFFGVLYHLKYPLKALEILHSKTREQLLLESHFIKTLSRKPLMRFYPRKELSNDESNWWGPNIKCIVEMLKAAGFRKVEVLRKYSQWPHRGRVIIRALP